MRKQYFKYVYNRIIFICVIWLMVFVSSVNATIVETSYGTLCSDTLCSNHNYDNDYIVYVMITTSNYQNTWGYGRIYNGSACSGTILYSATYPPDQWTNYYDYFSGHYDHTISFYRYSSGQNLGSCNQVTFNVKTYYGEDFYTITGNACGNGIISLLDTSDEILDQYNTSENPYYSFEIMNNTQYKLAFADRTYEFMCTGNIVEDNSLCDYQILYYVDDCANLFKNPYIHIIKNDDWADWLVSGGTTNTDVFIIPDEVQLNDKLDIFIDTDQGTQHRTIYVEIGEDWLYHSYKSWDLGVTVYDINTSDYISGAKVSVKQGCRINNYPCNTYGLTNSYGFVKTFDLSNQNYQVKVEKEGYNTFEYQTISANFDAQHTDYGLRVNLQDSTKGDGNGTVGDPDNPDDEDGTGGDSDDELPQTPCLLCGLIMIIKAFQK